MSRRTFRSVSELIDAAGMKDETIGAFDDLDEEALWGMIAARVGPMCGDVAVRLSGQLHDYVQEQGKRRRLSLTVLQHLPVERLAAGGLLSERRRADQERERVVAQLSVVPAPKAPRGGRWPHRAAGGAHEGQKLDELEAAARDRLLKKIGDELLRLGAPVVAALGASAADHRGLRYVAAGRRAATLRRRLGDWRRLAAWAEGQGQEPGFPDALTVLAYLEARAGEPCGRTVLRSAIDALRFMEESGQVPPEQRVSTQGIVDSAVRELALRLEPAAVERRQAQYLPVRLVQAFEEAVMDRRLPPFARYYAWLRLLKYWGALRFDDLRWADPTQMRQENGGLDLRLERTKVSGPGKRVGALYAYVSAEAYYQERGWLAEGLAVRQEYIGDNPYMFPLPSRDLQCARKVPGDYGDAAVASQALFGQLMVWSEGAEPRPLLPGYAGLFWTEHSERNALPTAAAALGMGDDVVRRLGRWQVGRVTDAYVRSTRQIIARAQEDIATRVRAKGADFLGEAATLGKFAQYMREKGHSGSVIDQVIADLTHFDADSGTEEEPAEAPRAPAAVQEAPTAGPLESEDSEGEATDLTGYVVSVVGRKGFRRLHHLGRCPLVPGVDYRQYIYHGERAPPEDAYDSICARCWPPTARKAGEDRASSASSSGESSD